MASASILSPACVGCTACSLSTGPRTNVVPSYGPDYPGAAAAFVGEAPGATEDYLGEPFRGKSGRLLDKIIKYLGYHREEVFIGNIVKCRPFQNEPYNNKPTKKQQAICYRTWLHPELVRARPNVIVALGRIAADKLHHDLWRLGGLHTTLTNVPTSHTVLMLRIFHPAYWLRTRDPEFKKQVKQLKKDIRIWTGVCEKMGINEDPRIGRIADEHRLRLLGHSRR